MAWADVQAKLAAYDAMEYADNTGGTSASYKLLRSFNANTAADVPVNRRDEFEEALDCRAGACANLAKSKGWRPNKLNKV